MPVAYFSCKLSQLCWRGSLTKKEILKVRTYWPPTPTYWSGKNWSDRLWDNNQRFADAVEETVTVGLLAGLRYDEMRDNLLSVIGLDDTQGAKYNARRLVMTECNYVANQGHLMGYQAAGIEYYIYLATLDLRTSEIRRKLDGQRFPVAEATPGTNLPPMHPHCRSTTMCDMSRGQLNRVNRAARDPVTGKSVTIPGYMTYREWYAKYVDGQMEQSASKKSLSLSSGSAKVGDGNEYTTLDHVKDVDFNDTEAVNYEIRSFCNDFSNAEIEHSLVITQRGKAYTFSGTSVSVDPTVAIDSEELKGSISIHNHPVPAGESKGDSFSYGDLTFAAGYKTGAQFLTSGTRRDIFVLTKEYSEAELSQAWETAKTAMREKAFNGELIIENEQEEIMKILSAQLEGLFFYELPT